MQIRVRVTGLLTEYFPAGKGELQVILESALTIKEILKKIKVSHELVLTIIVNGERKDLLYVPKEGEEIVLISPLAGG